MLARAVLVVFCLALNSVAARAQLYDPEKGSPMSLLVAPKDGIAYYELRKQAAQLVMANAAEAELPERDAVYVQFNGVLNDAAECLPAFGVRLWSVLEAQKPRNLIIDLRHNTGGTTSLYPELLRTVIAYTRVPDRKLYVLIGRRTYSAAANFITDRERLANPVFVGEASSECRNLNGDVALVPLPHSDLSGAISGVRWNLSRDVFDGRREMSPHVPVQLTAAAYFAGHDPAPDAVFTLINRSQK